MLIFICAGATKGVKNIDVVRVWHDAGKRIGGGICWIIRYTFAVVFMGVFVTCIYKNDQWK